MLSLWNPLIPEKIKSDSKLSTRNYFDRLLSEPFETIFSDVFNTSIYGIEYYKNTDGSLIVSVDVPGITEENINVELTNNILTVKGERKNTNSSYSVYKTINIPEGYETDNIKAELKHGVLSLTLKNKPIPQKEVKKIEVISSK